MCFMSLFQHEFYIHTQILDGSFKERKIVVMFYPYSECLGNLMEVYSEVGNCKE